MLNLLVQANVLDLLVQAKMLNLIMQDNGLASPRSTGSATPWTTSTVQRVRRPRGGLSRSPRRTVANGRSGARIGAAR